MSKAYLGCHTDITIPYDELGAILVETADGREIPLIQDGRFVLAGTEELNKELDALENKKYTEDKKATGNQREP